MGLCPLCGYNICTMIHIFNCCQYSLRAGRYNWRHDMVLRKIVHHIVPAIHRARAFTEDETDGYQKSGKAFKANKCTKYDNMKWQSTQRSDRMQKCQDWAMVWVEDKSPAMIPTVTVVTAKRPDVTIYSTTEKSVCGDRTDCPCRRKLCTSQQQKKV